MMYEEERDVPASSEDMEALAVQKAQELFQVCDTEEKGFITKKDMQRLQSQLPLDPDQLEAVFDSLDDDKNGFLTLEEFIEGFGSFLGFKTIDQDQEADNTGDGVENVYEGVDSTNDDIRFKEMLNNVGASKLYDDEKAIKGLWLRLQKEDGDMATNFEDFLYKVSNDIRKSKVDFETLESALKSKSLAYDEEVKKLYEEMELQIKQEKERILKEEQLKEQQIREAMENEIKEKDRQLQELLMKHQEMEERLSNLNIMESETKQENEKLQKDKEDLQDQLMKSQTGLEESRAYIDQLRHQHKDEKRERARAALRVTETIALERESLVKQLDSLRDINKQLRDDKDEAETRREDLSTSTMSEELGQILETEEQSRQSARRREQFSKQGSILGNYFPDSRGRPPLGESISEDTPDVDVDDTEDDYDDDCQPGGQISSNNNSKLVLSRDSEIMHQNGQYQVNSESHKVNRNGNMIDITTSEGETDENKPQKGGRGRKTRKSKRKLQQEVGTNEADSMPRETSVDDTSSEDDVGSSEDEHINLSTKGNTKDKSDETGVETVKKKMEEKVLEVEKSVEKTEEKIEVKPKEKLQVKRVDTETQQDGVKTILVKHSTEITEEVIDFDTNKKGKVTQVDIMEHEVGVKTVLQEGWTDKTEEIIEVGPKEKLEVTQINRKVKQDVVMPTLVEQAGQKTEEKHKVECKEKLEETRIDKEADQSKVMKMVVERSEETKEIVEVEKEEKLEVKLVDVKANQDGEMTKQVEHLVEKTKEKSKIDPKENLEVKQVDIQTEQSGVKTILKEKSVEKTEEKLYVEPREKLEVRKDITIEQDGAETILAKKEKEIIGSNQGEKWEIKRVDVDTEKDGVIMVEQFVEKTEDKIEIEPKEKLDVKQFRKSEETLKEQAQEDLKPEKLSDQKSDVVKSEIEFEVTEEDNDNGGLDSTVKSNYRYTVSDEDVNIDDLVKNYEQKGEVENTTKGTINLAEERNQILNGQGTVFHEQTHEEKGDYKDLPSEVTVLHSDIEQYAGKETLSQDPHPQKKKDDVDTKIKDDDQMKLEEEEVDLVKNPPTLEDSKSEILESMSSPVSEKVDTDDQQRNLQYILKPADVNVPHTNVVRAGSLEDTLLGTSVGDMAGIEQVMASTEEKSKIDNILPEGSPNITKSTDIKSSDVLEAQPSGTVEEVMTLIKTEHVETVATGKVVVQGQSEPSRVDEDTDLMQSIEAQIVDYGSIIQGTNENTLKSDNRKVKGSGEQTDISLGGGDDTLKFDSGKVKGSGEQTDISIGGDVDTLKFDSGKVKGSGEQTDISIGGDVDTLKFDSGKVKDSGEQTDISLGGGDHTLKSDSGKVKGSGEQTDISLGSDDDTLKFDSGKVKGRGEQTDISLGGGDDTLKFDSGKVKGSGEQTDISLGGDDDTLKFDSGKVKGSGEHTDISLGGDDDTLKFDSGKVKGSGEQTDISLGGDDDTLKFDSGKVKGSGVQTDDTLISESGKAKGSEEHTGISLGVDDDNITVKMSSEDMDLQSALDTAEASKKIQPDLDSFQASGSFQSSQSSIQIANNLLPNLDSVDTSKDLQSAFDSVLMENGLQSASYTEVEIKDVIDIGSEIPTSVWTDDQEHGEDQDIEPPTRYDVVTKEDDDKMSVKAGQGTLTEIIQPPHQESVDISKTLRNGNKNSQDDSKDENKHQVVSVNSKIIELKDENVREEKESSQDPNVDVLVDNKQSMGINISNVTPTADVKSDDNGKKEETYSTTVIVYTNKYEEGYDEQMRMEDTREALENTVLSYPEPKYYSFMPFNLKKKPFYGTLTVSGLQESTENVGDRDLSSQAMFRSPRHAAGTDPQFDGSLQSRMSSLPDQRFGKVVERKGNKSVHFRDSDGSIYIPKHDLASPSERDKTSLIGETDTSSTERKLHLIKQDLLEEQSTPKAEISSGTKVEVMTTDKLPDVSAPKKKKSVISGLSYILPSVPFSRGITMDTWEGKEVTLRGDFGENHVEDEDKENIPKSHTSKPLGSKLWDQIWSKGHTKQNPDQAVIDGPRGQPVGAVDTDGEMIEPSPTSQRVFKVVFVGDSGVGKSSFIHRFCNNTFNPSFSATIGVDFQVKTIYLKDTVVVLQLWDTAGQERFRSITKQYFRKADGVVVMYDVTSEASFINVRNWMTSIKENVEDTTVIEILGNKTDMAEGDDRRVVRHRDGEKLAQEYETLFFECSAKSGNNVKESMEAIADLLKDKEDEELEKALQLQDETAEKKKCCK